jgi:hypothetical protein
MLAENGAAHHLVPTFQSLMSLLLADTLWNCGRKRMMYRMDMRAIAGCTLATP